MSQRWVNAFGSSAMFSIALLMTWLMVKFLRLSWDTALLVQILWLVSLNRWHQPSLAAGVDGG